MAEHEVSSTKMTPENDLPTAKEKKRRSKTERVKLFKERAKTGLREENEVSDLQSRYETINTSLIKNFRDFPLSKKTLRGLSDSGYQAPTDIQKEAIGLALRKLDVLGAAKTGSGKTLAFVVPVLEVLYCKRWTRLDGLGAIIITPTRELAYQIFETLRKVGRHHDFSAGLIIGGKDMKFESKRLHQCNIMICTPGRLLHHMDENPLLDTTPLQILVIDEADRCLDLGFEHTMNGIIENLPPNRQTLLFSATQTKSVKDLARLSLKDPMYVSVHEHAKHSTPEGLLQSYLVTSAEHKIDLLWSFIKNHRKHKTIVFLTSCKQVRFVHQAFCRLRPGYSLMALHGGLHQLKRMAVYEEFCRKESAVLLATDIAARGLDFPDVKWVLQLDCPEDAAAYVHRAGRTARYTQGGEALLVLLPSEEKAMLERLKERKVPISKIEANPRKLVSIQRKLEAMLARDPELKAMAQRALVTYMKATFLMKDKEVFDVSQIDLQALSRSCGLAVAPRVRFLQKQGINMKKPKQVLDEGSIEPERTTDVLTHGKETTTYDFGIEDNDEDILVVKRKDHALSDDDDNEDVEEEKKKKNRVLTKEAVAKRILKKKIKANQNVQFDEEGNRIFDPIKERVTEAARNYELDQDDTTTGGINIEKARDILKKEDEVDKQVFRARIKAKHREERLKAKAERRKAAQAKEENDEGDADAAYESDGSVPESVADIIDALPDPDRVYGNNDNDRESGDEEEEEERDFPKVKAKRKMESTKSVKAKKRKKESNKFVSDLNLQDEEQLALQLLQH